MFCRFCGKNITDDATFCSYCGKSLSFAATQSTIAVLKRKLDTVDRSKKIGNATVQKTKQKSWRNKLPWIVSAFVLIVVGSTIFVYAGIYMASSNKQYTNDRFGYSIDYPSDLSAVAFRGGDGAGQHFISKDGSVSLEVYGENNVFEDTPVSYFKGIMQGGNKNITYQEQKGNWLEISSTDGNEIIYEKIVVGAGSINVFIITYPKAQSKQFDSIITHMNESFKTPNINVGG